MKINIKYRTFPVYLLFFCFIFNFDKGCTTTTKNAKCSDKPELRLVSPTDLKHHDIHYDPEKREIAVKNRLNLTIECTSRKPIDFDFEGYLALQLYEIETSRNRSEEGEECFVITMQLASEREATGQYKCWNIDGKETANDSLYVYAHGGTPPYLLLGDFGEEMTVHPKNENVAVLPCIMTHPRIPVALYKINNNSNKETFEHLTEGEHLHFDSKHGFILNLKKFPDPFGKYKCLAKSHKSIHDEVVFELLELEPKLNEINPKPRIFENDLTKGKDYLHQSLICTGDFGLKMISTSNCKTPIECKLMEKCMNELTICPQSCKCSSTSHACSKTLLKQQFNSEDHLDEKCETIGRNENGGVLHCSSSVHLEGNTFVYFVGLDGHIVHNWKTVAKNEILGTVAPLGDDVIYNVGEKVPFICVASRFVFSRGFQWKIELVNGTMISTNATRTNVFTSDSLIKEEVIIHISQPEIRKIVCEAPVWNETTWISSKLSLRIRDTVAPTFINPTNTSVYFYSNEKNKSIVCEAQGFPHPDILWYKDGEEIRSDLIYDARRNNITVATLVFPEIGETDDFHVYTCNASNPRGMAFKTYTIRIRASMWTIVFCILGAALFVAFVVVLIMSVQLCKGAKKLVKKAQHIPVQRVKVRIKEMLEFQNGYTFHFSDFDVNEFKRGDPEAVKRFNDAGEKAFYLPYDEDLYEITEDALDIETDNVLGQGEFGRVLKGTVTRKDEEPFPVAVKTVRGNDIQQLKALLSELKIMIFIGNHPNVVKLVGAVTTQLAEKKAFVIVEYCALGNLENYIRSRRTSFLDEFSTNPNLLNPAIVAPSYVRINYAIKTTDLIRWSYQISTGLEYLSNKKIIHGDISLRNMLISADQNVKITDFGLSKQLYKCSSYYLTKYKDIPLPWKWLSPEALHDHSLSVQSDVWSFGILLWEMFSLAESPYTGVVFGAEFLQLLANGFRLNKPDYCNMEIYNLMRQCWRQELSQRPSFTYLRRALVEMLPPELTQGYPDDDIGTQNANNHLQEGQTIPSECQPLRA